MSKATCIAFDGSILVESKQIKGVDTLRIQPIGSRKEFLFKFDVSLPPSLPPSFPSPSLLSCPPPSRPTSLISSPTSPTVKAVILALPNQLSQPVVCLCYSLLLVFHPPPPLTQSHLEHYMWYRILRDTVHKAETKTGSVSTSGLLTTEGGGILVARRQASSPSGEGRGRTKLGHTKSVPIL